MRLSPFLGLCAMCQHVRVIRSARGSFFILCGQAKHDPDFNKYPVLPVLHCAGYEAMSLAECDLAAEADDDPAGVDTEV